MKIKLTNDGSRTLYSEKLNASYHSESGAWSESRLVYLEHSGVDSSLGSGDTTNVLEIGLGTGMNFLVTADRAIKFNTPLTYTAIDNFRPPTKLIREMSLQSQLHTPGLETAWLNYYDQPIQHAQPATWVPPVVFTPLVGQAESLIQDENLLPSCSFDAIYLDAFSPAISPELWTEPFFGDLHRVLKTGGRLTTYCVKSVVQKRLKSLGFHVQTPAGPEGGKRQVLLATKD